MSKVDTLQLDAYQLIENFLSYLNSKNFSKLENEFELSSSMYEEITEELERSIEQKAYTLSLTPYNEIDSSKAKNPNRPIFTIEETEDDGEYIVECNIYNESKLTDLILQGYLEYENGKIKFTLPLFKS
ncbi:hypothetical protein AMD27_06365 [Acinetobacter sp. TGL-Y2]|uniref:hypothetical protein n=1 Tax=Acinetobacter sp. TGL-Y2 TaxID=1407071 RepID=UPI0007A663B9|nr:hypothetical protein [Acinetobacter sp. TGL-Y2]AMW78541.1 hypothetical protein AMD27_06365 [Acinetobacter sp. TGL-Y2]